MSERAQLHGDLSLSRGAPTRRWMPILAAGLSIGQYARSVMHRVAALTAVLLVAIWALDGQGYLWPAWAWLGLAVPVLLDLAAGWAWRQSPGAVRRVACVWALAGVAAVILLLTSLLTWLLAGLGSARHRDGSQQLLALRAARSGASRLRPPRAEGQGGPAHKHSPAGRR